MDWSKAKTILIIAFIITNLLLIKVLIKEKDIEEPTIKEEFFLEVEKLLLDKNIYLDTEIPKDIPYLNTMVVKYDKVNIKNLNKKFFNSLGVIEVIEEDLEKIVHSGESLTVFNKKFLVYKNENPIEIYSNLTREKAIEIAEDFLQKKGFNTSDMKLSFIKEGKGSFYLEYSKIFNGYFVEKAFTNFQIDSRGVKKFERLWLLSEEVGDTNIYISTAPKALLELLGMDQVYGKTITDISLCYYFDLEKHSYLEELGEARQGKTVPAWRVQFSDGYKVFIDDYEL